MTYFNPKIYNKQNLKDEDRKDIDFYKELFDSVISKAEFEAEMPSDIEIFDNIRNEIIDTFARDLRVNLGYALQDLVVGIIDGYEDEDIKEVDNPDTYYYSEE